MSDEVPTVDVNTVAATVTPVVVPEPYSGAPEPLEVAAASLVAASVSLAPAILETSEPSTIHSESAGDIVDRWFRVTFQGSAIAGTAEQWNFLHTAKEELKTLLNNR